jgi:hypothetical protein
MLLPMPAIPSQGYHTLPLTGTTDASRPALGGVVLYDVVQPVKLTGATTPATVDIQFRVVRSTETGLLDFYWRIVKGVAPATGHLAFQQGFVAELKFTGLLFTYVDYRPDGVGTIAPYSVDVYGTQGTCYFFFKNGIDLSQSTEFFFLSTNATEFSPTAGVLLSAIPPTFPMPGATAVRAPRPIPHPLQH